MNTRHSTAKRIGLLCVSICSLCFLAKGQTAAIHFAPVPKEILESRLRRYGGKNGERQSAIHALFAEAGCPTEQIAELPVKGVKESNVLCVLPGKSDDVIIVSGHFDKVDVADGVADNWSGASLLPSLYQALSLQPRDHTYVFIAFAGEEKGLLGSHSYARSLTKEQRAKIHAVVNIDTLGLGPTEVWGTHSDPKLIELLGRVATSMKLPVTGMNADQVGDSDESSFREFKIPCLMIHSITQKTLGVLHSPLDTYKAIQFDNYNDTYHLLCAFLAYVDQSLDSSAQPN